MPKSIIRLSRVDNRYTRASSSYILAWTIFIMLPHIWQNVVCFGDFLYLTTLCDDQHIMTTSRKKTLGPRFHIMT